MDQIPALSEADRFLLGQVRRGEAEGWSQLVDRYRGRLLAFARQRCRNPTDAEDLVQDTFVKFLTALPSFRGQSSLETYLFTILRRTIIDALRLRRLNVCRLDTEDGAGEGVASSDPTASWYASRDEEHGAMRAALAGAMSDLVESCKRSLRFEDLELAEAIFYANLRNRRAAELTGMTESQVGLKKHRWLTQLRETVLVALPDDQARTLLDSPELLPGTLHEVWESGRLSCPKRSTLGRFLLDTLEPPWERYVRFHAEVLGCGFCLANLQDMRQQVDTGQAQPLQQRILQSTIGFFRNG